MIIDHEDGSLAVGDKVSFPAPMYADIRFSVSKETWETEADVNPNHRPGVGIKTDGLVEAIYGGAWERGGKRYDLFKFPGFPTDDSCSNPAYWVGFEDGSDLLASIPVLRTG